MLGQPSAAYTAHDENYELALNEFNRQTRQYIFLGGSLHPPLPACRVGHDRNASSPKQRG